MLTKVTAAVVSTIALGLVLAAVAGGQDEPQLCFGATPTITGSGTIVGTGGDDVIVGSAGNDTILAGDGNDKVCGGAGDDDPPGAAAASTLGTMVPSCEWSSHCRPPA